MRARVQSIRFALVPLAVILVTLSASFSLMLPIATSAMDVVNFAPSVMMSATIAMSVDYSVCVYEGEGACVGDEVPVVTPASAAATLSHARSCSCCPAFGRRHSRRTRSCPTS